MAEKSRPKEMRGRITPDGMARMRARIGILAPRPKPFNTVASEDSIRHYCYGYGEDTVYLSPAPLYHAAPLHSCLRIHRAGGTCIVMERFDAERREEIRGHARDRNAFGVAASP